MSNTLKQQIKNRLTNWWHLHNPAFERTEKAPPLNLVVIFSVKEQPVGTAHEKRRGSGESDRLSEQRSAGHSGFRRKKKFYETAGHGTDRFPMKKYLSETESE